jgi:sugar transferase EpsL
MWSKFFKKGFDVSLAFLLCVLFSWLILIIWLLVRIFLGSPAIFKQPRVGYQEHIFTVYKFRTMTNKKDDAGNLLSDALRLTRFGKFLRASSLDELPQLFNILKGDMSFVGPRPLLLEYLPLYNVEQKRRHWVMPGITGWAQVNGRNAISWQEKFKLDCWYVDHLSFFLDMQIMLLTLKKVFKREGVSQQNQATMEKFTGKN